MENSTKPQASVDTLLAVMSTQLEHIVKDLKEIKEDIKNKVELSSFNELKNDFETHKLEVTGILKDYINRRENIRGMIILISVCGLAVLTLIGFTTKLYVESLKVEIANTASAQMLQKLTDKYEIIVK